MKASTKVLVKVGLIGAVLVGGLFYSQIADWVKRKLR